MHAQGRTRSGSQARPIPAAPIRHTVRVFRQHEEYRRKDYPRHAGSLSKIREGVPADDYVARVREAVIKDDMENMDRLAEDAWDYGMDVLQGIGRGLAAGIRKVGEKFVVAGTSVTEECAREIGSDGTVFDASNAVRWAPELVGGKP